jgi:hypothetical protein
MAYDYANLIAPIFYHSFIRIATDTNTAYGLENELGILEVPIADDVFDVPVFLWKEANDWLRKNPVIDCMTVSLNTYSKPAYKTPARYMRDVLVSNFFRNGMVTLKDDDGLPLDCCYATGGMVIDHSLNIMMAAATRCKKAESDRAGMTTVSHVLYVSPECYCSNDKVSKFLIKNVMNNVISLGSEGGHPLNVQIGEMPFHIRQVTPPDIHTTDREILQTALEHIDEIVL